MMKKVALQLVLAVACLALALPVLAKADKTSSSPKPKVVTMNIYDQTMLGTTMVKPGTYKFVLETDKVTVETTGNKVVATVPGHWQDGKQKQSSTGFNLDGAAMKEIFVQGNASVFVLGS
jgi:hypothetical protein